MRYSYSMPNRISKIKKIASTVFTVIESLIGLAVIVAMALFLLLTFAFPLETLPRGATTDSIYTAAEELGVTEKDFRRYLCVMPNEADLLPEMIENGTDPVSATRIFLKLVDDVYPSRALGLATGYSFLLLCGAAILLASILKLTGKDPATRLREKRKEVSEYWHDKALHLRTMASYLDEGRFADEDWTVPAEGEGWEGADGLDRYFLSGKKAGKKEYEMLNEIPQWYWEMVEGELAVHIRSVLDANVINTTTMRLEALSGFIADIFRNHTEGPLTEKSSEVAALQKLTETLDELDRLDMLTKDVVHASLEGYPDRNDLFLSPFGLSDKWYDFMSDMKNLIEDCSSQSDASVFIMEEPQEDPVPQTEKSCTADETPSYAMDTLDGLSDEIVPEPEPAPEPEPTPESEPELEPEPEPEPKNEPEPETYDYYFGVDEPSETNSLPRDDEPREDEPAEDDVLPQDDEPGTPRQERDVRKALLYANYLKGVINGMMSDGKLSQKEGSALKAIFASWPSDIDNNALDMIVSPFTETKARPKAGEVKGLCSSLESVIGDYIRTIDAEDTFLKELDGAEFSGLARGVISDETINDDDIGVLKEWLGRHVSLLLRLPDPKANDPIYEQVNQALEDGVPLAIYNVLRHVQAPATISLA